MKSKAHKKIEKTTKPNRSTSRQRAVREALDWAFDIAMSRVSHPDDIATVERVRDALEARIAKRYTPVSIEDLQFASDLLIAAMQVTM